MNVNSGNVYWTKKELKKIANASAHIYKRFNMQKPVPSSHLMIHKLTGGKLPKALTKKKKFPKFWFESPSFMSIKNSDVTNRFPKKINNYILHSGNFFMNNNIFYSLLFPICYEKIFTTPEDSGNGVDWYLILSNSEENLRKAVDGFCQHPVLFTQLTISQRIRRDNISEYLKALEKVRPEFAKEIQLYLEVN